MCAVFNTHTHIHIHSIYTYIYVHIYVCIYIYIYIRTHGIFLQPFNVLHTMPTLPLLAQFITVRYVVLHCLVHHCTKASSYKVDVTRLKHHTLIHNAHVDHIGLAAKK